MTRFLLPLLLAMPAMARPAMAQDDQAIAQAVVLPMVQSVPDVPVETQGLLAACIVATATADERASLAAAGAPTPEAVTVVNGIVARPDVLACVQASAGQ